MKYFAIILLIIAIIFKIINKDLLISSKNVLSSKLSSKNVLSSKLSSKNVKDLKEGQIKMTRMLYEFDKLCIENNITYFIIAGTLLGAIVYKGWIPWDGDIDVEILKSDWHRLNDILKTNLPTSMWLQTEETDIHYKSRMPEYIKGKIRDLNSCYLNCQDGVKNHNGFMIDLNLFYINSNNMLVMPDNLKVNSLKYNDVFPIKRIRFENIFVNAPNNSEKYLLKKYGNNYRRILPIEKRYPHEGILDPTQTCEHHYKLYPQMYKKQ